MKKIWLLGILCMALFISSVNSSAIEINRGEEDQDTVQIGSLVPQYYFNFNGTSEDTVLVVKENTEVDTKLVEDSSKKVKYANGKFGEALYLDGTYGLQLPVGELGSSYTIAFWVKTLKDMTDFMPVLQAGTNLAEGASEKWLNITKQEWPGEKSSPLIWSKDNKYYENAMLDDHTYWPWYAGLEESNRNIITPENDWQHIIVTVDGTKKLNLWDANIYSSKSTTYVNGEFFGTGVVADDIFDANVETYLGINPWDDLFTGYIDDLQFYNVAVTGQQAKEIFAYDAGEAEDEEEISGELTKSDLKVSPAKKTIKIGDSFSIRIMAVDESEWIDLSAEEWEEICEENIDNISFRSTKSSVASVGKTTGKIKGKKKGSAIIKTTIDFANGESATYKTKVYVKR